MATRDISLGKPPSRKVDPRLRLDFPDETEAFVREFGAMYISRLREASLLLADYLGCQRVTRDIVAMSAYVATEDLQADYKRMGIKALACQLPETPED